MSKYEEALSLYRTTDLSVVEICKQTNTPLTAFRAYLRRCHRDLLLARYGVIVSPEEAADIRLRKSRGQTPQSHAKYKDAIAACDDIEYIELNISQIAHIFKLNPSSLNNQLRNHFPEILERREKERHRLGVNDGINRGVKEWCKKQYEDAVKHLRQTDDTIPETAEKFNLSYAGLREHLLYYHKDLINHRSKKRGKAAGKKVKGAITGNGQKHLPQIEQVVKYEEAIRLYRTTTMTLKEIAEATRTTLNGLRNYLRIWNKDLIIERRCGVYPEDTEPDLTETKRYLKSTAFKYKDAIRLLKETGRPTAEIARELALHPDIFREYLHEHEPELAASLGMKRLDNGRLVLARSAEKYSEAITIYASTSETLKSIAKRLGLQYNSLNGFISRNHPEATVKHNQIVEEESVRKQKEAKLDEINKAKQQKENERNKIIAALQKTNNNRSKAAKLLGVSKSALYNKLHEYNIL